MLLLVRAAFRPEGADAVLDDVYLSGSLDTLRALLAEGGAEFHAHAGYAGWGPGQLDGEVMRGDWYVTPADAATIFEHPPDDVWPALIKQNAGLWVRQSPIRKAYPPTVCARAGSGCRRQPAPGKHGGNRGVAYAGYSSSR